MESGVNNEIRPSAPGGDIESVLERLLRTGITFKATGTFSGWMQRVEVDAPNDEVLNYFRLLHHLERYWFAADLLESWKEKDLAVIDIGLGEAHGLLQFLNRMPGSMTGRTVGVEIDKEIADRVRAQYPFIEVLNANVEEVNNTEAFDIVFCFELMGNKSLSSDERLLQQLDRLCSPGGYIFLSIAAFASSEAGQTRAKDYSARIYDTNSFKEIVGRMFSEYRTRFFGQVYPLKRMFPSQVGVRENPGLERDTDFLICVAKKNQR